MRDPDSGWIQLSLVELFLLWSAMGLGEPPDVLEVPHVGRTPARRAELSSEVSASLVDRGLGTTGSPARDLAGFLRTLASAEVSLDARVHGDGLPLFGFAGSAGRNGAAIARVGDEVRIGPVTPGRLTAPLLGSLTPLPAGPDGSANLRAADFASACAEGERDGAPGFAAALRHAGVRSAEINAASRVLTAGEGGGQLGASGRGRRTMSWVDTPDGRYAMRPNGTWVTITPVDPARLAAMAEEMLDEVR